MQKVILTPRELILPEVRTIDSDMAEAYRESLSSYGEKARQTLDIFSDRKGELAESNCFAPIILRDFLPEGARLATMADLGRATEINPGFLTEFYSDTGLGLRTAGDSYEPNDFLAKDLAEQLKKRRINLKHPKVIYFDALDLREEPDSAYGLAYDLSERAKLGENIIDAPEIVRDFRFKTMDEQGIPIEDAQGNRTSYTRGEGLSRFCLGRDSYVYSYDRLLAGSCGNGRVVVVSAEGTRVDLDKHVQRLQELRDEEIAKLNERYEKAEVVLRGN